MPLERWTPLTFLSPRRYIDPDGFWADFDFEAWSDEYEWESDPWNGYLDVARRPRQTVAMGRGDCEDYALVALAWLAGRDTPSGLAFCWEPPYPWPRHVVAYDDERVYSSGEVTVESVDEYVDRSQYVYALRRRVA